MDILLNTVESRILGALIEKQLTTPDYYPLTLNALIAACNQKSNRDPLMNLDEKAALRGLDGLREKQLSWQIKTVGSRTPKYEHNLKGMFKFSREEIGILCVLLLRGPQTLGELKSRTLRLHKFEELSQVEALLQALSERQDGPFVIKLPRQTGRKEHRYAHLFCGEPEVEESAVPGSETARIEVLAENERIADLEQKVADIQADIHGLKHLFLEFRKQFE